MALPLVALSGEEVVRALARLGFVTSTRDETRAVLEKNLRRVTLPMGENVSISPEQLLAIVREAGVTYAELVEALGATAFPDPKHDSQVRARKRS